MNCLKCNLSIENVDTKYGLHSKCFASWFDVSESATFVGLTRKNAETFNSPDAQVDGSFFHGTYKKYSAVLEGSSYILKMRDLTTPELPAVEYLCNQIGKLLGVPVAEFFIVYFETELVFVTRNFMSRYGGPANLSHIYHHLTGKPFNCEEIIKVISDITKRPFDINIFIKTLLFDALIGNHDRHGRNLGLIVQSNYVTLSPIYDNVSYLSLEQGFMLKADFNPTGKIATQDANNPSMRDYVIELELLGFEDIVKEFYTKVKLDQILSLVENSFCTEDMKKAMRTLICKRYKELENEIRVKAE